MAKPKRIWDNYKVIGSVQKSDAIRIDVAAATRDGVRYINLREFYKRKTDAVWMPGRDGLTVPVNIPVEQGTKMIKPIYDLIDMFNKAIPVATAMELVDEENAVYMTPKEKK